MAEEFNPAGKEDSLRRRDLMIRAIRRFFYLHDYLEVETPIRIPAPAPEPHIDALSSGEWFLQTSPELCMKRLLAAGYPRIFQICKCFRSGERGARHLPEFTMLEWYRAGIDYRGMMQECEALLKSVFDELGGQTFISSGGRHIDYSLPWERITVEEAFLLHGSMTMQHALARGLFDEIMGCRIEPELGLGRPVFIFDYPLLPGSLARSKPSDPRLAERFELYIAGVELANAFTELTDAAEQERRFREAGQLRLEMGSAAYPPAEPFLRALPQMPEAAGIALGIDRLAMVINDRENIADVVSFTPEDL